MWAFVFSFLFFLFLTPPKSAPPGWDLFREGFPNTSRQSREVERLPAALRFGQLRRREPPSEPQPLIDMLFLYFQDSHDSPSSNAPPSAVTENLLPRLVCCSPMGKGGSPLTQKMVKERPHCSKMPFYFPQPLTFLGKRWARRHLSGCVLGAAPFVATATSAALPSLSSSVCCFSFDSGVLIKPRSVATLCSTRLTFWHISSTTLNRTRWALST